MKGLEQELMDLERSYWQALQDGDIDTQLRLSDDPVIVTGAQGVGMVRRQQMAEMMKSANYTLLSFKLTEPKVRMLGDDVAILAYKVHEELTVDDEPVTLDASDASTWVRRNGKWVCALHTESILGDPFGRDRKVTH